MPLRPDDMVGQAIETPSAAETLRASGELFRALTLYSGDIISLLDAEGRLIYNSPATERINGFTARDLEGIDTFDLIHPEDRATVQAVFAEVLAQPGAVHTVRYRYATKAGGWQWMEAIASNQLDNPAVRGVVTNSRDISERVRAEEERRRLESQMLHVQKLESLGVLAGGVAHDFNNLLTVIIGGAELLRGQDDLEVIRTAATQLERAARQAAELTQLLLAYAGKSSFEARPTALAELLEGGRPLLEVSVSKKDHRLTIELDRDVPLVDVDAGQIRQVILNLVQNGSEAIAGSGEVRVELAQVTIDEADLAACVVPSALGVGDRAVRLRVRDSGVGLDDATRQRIFDPFFTTKQTGRGLGLAAVLGIVRAHGVALALRSRPGEGTTFDLYFAPSRHSAGTAGERAEREWRGSGSVLVVDDDEGPGQMACALLRTIGFEATHVSGGAEALARCQGDDGAIALAVVDMIMPDIDGAATFRRLRAIRPELPILLYSGYDDDVATGCLGEPRTAFLRKPFLLEDLVAALRGLLEREQPQRGS